MNRITHVTLDDVKRILESLPEDQVIGKHSGVSATQHCTVANVIRILIDGSVSDRYVRCGYTVTGVVFDGETAQTEISMDSSVGTLIGRLDKRSRAGRSISNPTYGEVTVSLVLAVLAEITR